MAHSVELEDRINKCNKILGENPNSQIFAALAEAYRKKGDLDMAFRVCQSGLKIHPDYGSAHMVMAKINFDKGLYDWAEMEVEKSIKLDGSSYAADLLLSEIYIYKGEFAKAAKILNKLHSVDANNQQVIKLLELARKLPLQSPEKSKDPIASASLPPKEDITVIEHAPVKVAPKTEYSVPNMDSGNARISINRLLENLATVPGVDGVLFINSDGLVAERVWNIAGSPDEYGAFARDIEKSIQQQVDITGFGNYENILIEGKDLVISFLPIDNNLLLIRANERVNLGTLRLKLNALLKRLDVTI